jgi:hypothetical protein
LKIKLVASEFRIGDTGDGPVRIVVGRFTDVLPVLDRVSDIIEISASGLIITQATYRSHGAYKSYTSGQYSTVPRNKQCDLLPVMKSGKVSAEINQLSLNGIARI